MYKGPVQGWSLQESEFLFWFGLLLLLLLFLLKGLGFGSLNALRGPWLGKLDWAGSRVNGSQDFCPGYADQPKWPGSNAGWLAPWSLVPHRNPGGILGLIISRKEEVLRCESKEMPRKCQMCFSASARGANLSHPPTSRPSQDREWDQVGAPDPLSVCEFQDGGREPQVRSPEGQTSRRHFQAHIPTGSSLSSCP